jgi:hypothetical protein
LKGHKPQKTKKNQKSEANKKIKTKQHIKKSGTDKFGIKSHQVNK